MPERLDILVDGDVRHMTISEALEFGKSRQDTGDLSGAADVYQQIHTHNPEQVDAVHLLGVISHRLGELELAAGLIAAAISLKPDFAEAHSNLGVVYFDQGRMEDAEACYRRAIEINPEYADPHNNLGALHQRLGRLDDAIASYRNASAINPDYAEAHNNLATLLLLSGQFEEGWDSFSWRWKTPQFSNVLTNYPRPLWEGESLTGKRILVWEEQGVGESLLFAGLIPELQQKGAAVTVKCDPRLVPLYGRSFPEVTCFSADGSQEASPFDFQAPLADLGRWLRPNAASFPETGAYLKTDKARSAALRKRYRDGGEDCLVGLAWISKSPHYAEQKSMTLDALEPLLRMPGVTFVDLQYGDTSEERQAFTDRTGIDILHDEDVDQMIDLDGFAAQVAALDMVVTISNTTAHMAGGLGVDTLLMLDTRPIWYWQRERGDSPWYPSLRLFRQQTAGNWSDVIGGMIEAVRKKRS
ncbi:MAG: tetratricopeptide repeat protein [Alphaproteobacteria bacterium]|nr:tetratricopeptide repeat protein [Alphaproteobacteria bacterium]